MSDSPNEIIRHLPDPDRQFTRLNRRRVYPCPKCGENVDGCHLIRMKNKKFGTEDIEIPCPRCGVFHIANRKKGDDYEQYVRETGESYDMFKRVNDALNCAYGFPDEERSRARSDAYLEAARELKIADPDCDGLFTLYMMAVSDLLNFVRNGETDQVVHLCEVTLECNSISKYDLMLMLRNAYDEIHKHRDLVPPALYLKIKMEDTLVSGVMDRFDPFSDDDDEDDATDSICADLISIAEEFDALSKEEKAVCPFVAAEAWMYAMRQYRNGDDRKGEKDCAKKVISSVKKAVKAGAVADRHISATLLGAYHSMMTPRNSVYKDPVKDIPLMNNTFYTVKANYLYLDGLVAKVSDLDGFLPEMLSMEERAAALDTARFIIDAVESMDVIRDHVFPLCEAYIVRGSILRDDVDIETAFYYAILYRSLGAIDSHEFLTVMHEVQSKQKLGSPMSLKVFEALGYPVDILRH